MGKGIPEFIPPLFWQTSSSLARLILCMLYLNLSGCATWQAPKAFDDSVLRARAMSEQLKGVRLSAAILSSDDNQRMFGADINATEVQPIWIEIENKSSQMLWLLRTGTDPDLFSPLEVAWPFHKSFARDTNARLDEHFDKLSFQNPIAPGTTQSGILFTNPHQQTRILSVDLLGQGEVFPFTLFLPVPDDAMNSSPVNVKINQLIQAAPVDYQNAGHFRTRLEQLPCCATNQDETQWGDPFNVILVGELDHIAAALIHRGFNFDMLDFDKAQRLFSRQPDIVARKTGSKGMPANWLRIWVAPLRFRGQAVFLAQAGRPLGWRLEEIKEKDMVLDPNIDEIRNLLIQDLLYSGGLEKLAFIPGVGAALPGELRSSLSGARYHTDGLRSVLFLANRPLSLSDLEILDWYPALKLQEAEAIKEIEHGGK